VQAKAGRSGIMRSFRENDERARANEQPRMMIWAVSFCRFFDFGSAKLEDFEIIVDFSTKTSRIYGGGYRTWVIFRLNRRTLLKFRPIEVDFST
jgi:hypothetical protein